MCLCCMHAVTCEHIRMPLSVVGSLNSKEEVAGTFVLGCGPGVNT